MMHAFNACAACSTHKRPQDVPWHQHVVGCPVRSTAVAGRYASPTPTPAFTATPELELRSRAAKRAWTWKLR